MTHTEQAKGILGLIAIWASWVVANLPTIQIWVSILASIAAFVASVVYSWYYIGKIKRRQ